MKKFITAGAALVLSLSAHAEDSAKHYGDSVLTKEQFIEELKPKPKYKTRGIRFTQQEQQAESQSLALNVHFAHDSDQLTEQALAQLNPLGEALNSEQLAPYGFVIDGHTDASGGEDYNLNLSQRRALAVGNYLYENYSIDAARLNLTGKGESELYDSSQPDGVINRRVEITAVPMQQAQ